MEILYGMITPLAILGGLGLFFGAVLAIAGRCFGIVTDLTFDKVRAELPCANCGACGWGTCDKYAEAVANGKGFRFTVTSLEEGTDYTYDITVKDASNQTINSHTGAFTTQSNTPTDLENIDSQSPMTNCQKSFRNGQVYILKDDKTYTIMGTQIQ